MAESIASTCWRSFFDWRFSTPKLISDATMMLVQILSSPMVIILLAAVPCGFLMSSETNKGQP